MPERLSNQTLDIYQAGQDNLDEVWGIVKSCSDWLMNSGHKHWNGYYTRELVEKKLGSQQVYLTSEGSEPIATITLDTKPVEYYTREEMQQFTEPEKSALYVTTLAVLPSHQGKGIATELMHFAESEAKTNNLPYMRFDCKARYEELVRFYCDRGYKAVGEIIDKEDNYEPYFLMEKKITDNTQNQNSE